MKYFLIKIKLSNNNFLPIDIVNEIFSYLDLTKNIKNLNKIWYKRLITYDYRLYPKNFKKMCLNNETKKLEILLKNNAYKIIQEIHNHNLN